MNGRKQPLDLPVMFTRIAQAVARYPKAAMFELAEDGYTTVFEQLVACMISIRTLDEVTLVAARRLFSRARAPAELADLSIEAIDELIHPCTFHERKAAQIRNLAERVRSEFHGELPCDPQVLMSVPGVGIKCTNLTLGIACGQARVSVDVHVHRVTNRWGLVRTSTPEETTVVLEELLHEDQKIEINRLLVPFGKHICTGRLPHCSTCPVLEWCQQVGVTSHR
ncbi:MAG TPA: endonuclease III [Anaerolineaceae bacterium]|nr:endonuclease III [Anaerolineaceae bacterium]